MSLDDYLEWMRTQRRRSPYTIRMYRSVLAAFHREVVGDRRLDDVSLEEMEKFTTRVRTGGRAGNTPLVPADATVARDVAILGAYYTWARTHAGCTSTEVDGLHGPVVYNEAPRPLADDVWAMWWAAGLPVEARALLALGAVGGLRRSEMVRLHDTNVSADGSRILRIERKGRGRRVVDVPIGMAADALQVDAPAVLRSVAYRQEGHLLVPWLTQFGAEGAKTQAVQKWFDRMAKGLGLPRFTMHQLRHTCCTNLLRAGVPLHVTRDYMDHSDINTTARYARSDEQAFGEWLERR